MNTFKKGQEKVGTYSNIAGELYVVLHWIFDVQSICIDADF